MLACVFVMAEQGLKVHLPAHISIHHGHGNLDDAGSVLKGSCLAGAMQPEPLTFFSPLPARPMCLTFCTRCLSAIECCTHTFIHAFVHACMHAFIRSFVHSFVHACMHASISSFLPAMLMMLAASLSCRSHAAQIIALLQPCLQGHVPHCLHYMPVRPQQTALFCQGKL